MKHLLFALFAAFLCTQDALGGGAVTAFQPGKMPPEALQHVQVKAIVAEFLDPDRTELGKELGYLVWREILTAISDQRGAGVIIAHPPGKERLLDLLQQGYHQAALQIAESQKARMAVWGAVSEQDGRVIVDTYLSLVGGATRDELALRLNWAETLKGKKQDTGLVARVSRTRFNFPRVSISREELFVRPLLVQADTPVLERAGAGRTLATARVNETLQSERMEGEWFRVRLRDGSSGYVNSWNVYVPPRSIETIRAEPLSSQPSENAPTTARVAPNIIYAVLASRYIAKSGLWYRIATPAGEGWVRAYRVRTRFSLPVVHFAAGLYRYQLGRYEDAAREFEQFTRTEGAAADPPSLSTAYQLLGASQLMQISKSRGDVAQASEEPNRSFERAIAITPFDAGAYTLRAVCALAVRQSVGAALNDVTKALSLDPDEPDARNTLARMQALATNKGAPLPMELKQEVIGSQGKLLRDRIDELARAYKVEPM